MNTRDLKGICVVRYGSQTKRFLLMTVAAAHKTVIANEAAYCFFDYHWTGNDLMFCECNATTVCKITGRESFYWFSTEVNPAGETAFDRWKQECWDYIPSHYTLTLSELASMPNTSWAHLSIQDLEKKLVEAQKELRERISLYKGHPVLYSHWALKKRNRQIWREWYELRRIFSRMSEMEFLQLSLRHKMPF